MTETQWLASPALFPMLVFLQGAAASGSLRSYNDEGILKDGASEWITPRQIRNFAGACCERMKSLELNQPSRQALEVFCRYARDEVSLDDAQGELARVQRWAEESNDALSVLPALSVYRRDDASSAADCASNVVWLMAWGATGKELIAYYQIRDEHDLWMWGFEGPPHPAWRAACAAEESVQAGLLREVVGNPFRMSAVEPAWLAWQDGAIGQLAERIYQEDAFELLPMLADALEESGCGDARLVEHCRSEPGHVRGCWAIELIRGAGARVQE